MSKKVIVLNDQDATNHFEELMDKENIAPQKIHTPPNNLKSNIYRAARPNDMPFRIVGGTQVDSNKYPWFSYLEIQNTNGQIYSCGASLIDSNWAITAAHCLDENTRSVILILNTNNTITVGQAPTVIAQAEAIYINPNYDGNNNDIALIKIKPIVTNSGFTGNTNTIEPIKLNNLKNTDKMVGTQMDIIGYGTTTEGGHSTTIYKEVQIPIVSKTTCKNAYRSDSMNGKICAGLSEGGKDSCQGDSGGPMFKDGVLYGLVSYGIGCARPNIPGVYTDVKYFKKWIDNTINNRSITGKIWNTNETYTNSPTSSPISGPISGPIDAPIDAPIDVQDKDTSDLSDSDITLIVLCVLLFVFIAVAIGLSYYKKGKGKRRKRTYRNRRYR